MDRIHSHTIEGDCFDYLNLAFTREGASHIQMTNRKGGCISSILSPLLALRGLPEPDSEDLLQSLKPFLDQAVNTVINAPVFKAETIETINIRAFQNSFAFIGNESSPCPDHLQHAVYCMFSGATVSHDGEQTSFDFSIKFSMTGCQLLTDFQDTYQSILIYQGYGPQDSEIELRRYDRLLEELGAESRETLMSDISTSEFLPMYRQISSSSINSDSLVVGMQGMANLHAPRPESGLHATSNISDSEVQVVSTYADASSSNVAGSSEANVDVVDADAGSSRNEVAVWRRRQCCIQM